MLGHVLRLLRGHLSNCGVLAIGTDRLATVFVPKYHGPVLMVRQAILQTLVPEEMMSA